MQDDRIESLDEAVSFLSQLTREEDLRGHEDELLDIVVAYDVDAATFEKLAGTLLPPLWMDSDQERFRYNKFKLAAASERVLAEGESSFMRAVAMHALFNDYHDVLQADSKRLATYVGASGWQAAADPLCAAVLTYRLSGSGRRLPLLAEIIESSVPWRFSLVEALLQYDNLSDAPREIRGRMLAAVESYITKDPLCVAAATALKVLLDLESAEADLTLERILKRRGRIIYSLVEEKIWHTSFSVDFPEAYRHILEAALTERDVHLVTEKLSIDADTITGNGYAETFNRLIEALPPADLRILLAGRFSNVNAGWDGLRAALAGRHDDPAVERLVEQFLLKIGESKTPEHAMEAAAQAGSALESGRGYYDNQGPGLLLTISDTAPVKPTVETIEVAGRWLIEGRWYEQDYACYLLSYDTEAEGASARIGDALQRVTRLDSYERLNLARLAAEHKIYDVGPLLAERAANTAEAKILRILLVLYQQNYFDSSSREDFPHYGAVSEVLNGLLDTAGGLVPQWQQLAAGFDVPAAMKLFDAYFETAVAEDIEASWMQTFASRTMRAGVSGLREFLRKALDGTYAFSVTIAFLKALVSNKSVLQGLVRLIPEGAQFLREFGYPLLAYRSDDFLSDTDEVFNLVHSLPTPADDAHRALLERDLSLDAHPQLFGAVLSHLDATYVYRRLRPAVVRGLAAERRSPILRQNEDVKVLYFEGDGGEELLNIVQLIAALGIGGSADALEELTGETDRIFGPSLSVARAMMKSPALYEELAEEEQLEVDTPILLWSTLLIARRLAGMQPPSEEDPDPSNGRDARGLLLPFVEWTSLDEPGFEQIPRRYLREVFGWIGFNPGEPGSLLSDLDMDLADSHRLQLPLHSLDDLEGVELVASILEATVEQALVAERSGTAFIVGIRVGELDDPAPIARSTVDLSTFSKLALHLHIESDEGDQFIVRVGEERTVETVAKVLSDTFSGESVLFYMKEI